MSMATMVKATMVAILLAGACALQAQQKSGPSLAVFGVPMGATAAEVEEAVANRGYRKVARPGYCSDGELCPRRVNIENLPGTEFLYSLRGYKETAGRKESLKFAFVGPGNDSRTWSGGSDQTFGDSFHPSGDAPLLNDVLAEMRQRFGQPSVMLDGGGRALETSRRPVHRIFWLWDADGRPLAWTRAMSNTCAVAIHKASVGPGWGTTAGDNPVATDPAPFLLARQGNCAGAVRVELGHKDGVVYSLSVRVVDFRAGHDAQYRTTQLLTRLNAEADRQRSQQNRPDF